MAQHPAANLVPQGPVIIRLGAKKYDIRYGMLARVFIEERFGHVDEFVREYLNPAVTSERYMTKAAVTVVLAGTAHHHLTEEIIDELVGEDMDSLDQAAGACLPLFLKAFGYEVKGARNEEAEGEGEAEAAEEAASPSEDGRNETGPTPSSSPDES